jgi:hypothetical protein
LYPAQPGGYVYLYGDNGHAPLSLMHERSLRPTEDLNTLPPCTGELFLMLRLFIYGLEKTGT